MYTDSRKGSVQRTACSEQRSAMAGQRPAASGSGHNHRNCNQNTLMIRLFRWKLYNTIAMHAKTKRCSALNIINPSLKESKQYES